MDNIVPQTEVSRQAATATKGEFEEMLFWLEKIRSAKTNGEALGCISSYRHKLRLALLQPESTTFSEERIKKISAAAVEFLEILPKDMREEAIQIALRQIAKELSLHRTA